MSYFLYADAVDWFQFAIMTSPRFPAALFKLAICYQHTQQTKKALEVMILITEYVNLSSC